MKVMKILFFIVLNKNFIIPIYYDFDFESYLGWVPPPKQKKEREKKKKKVQIKMGHNSVAHLTFP